MATPSPVYLFKHVKHGTQNIQNYCQQWFSHFFRVQQSRFRTHWGSLRRSPDHLAGLRGPTSKGNRRGGEEKGRKTRERERGEERKGNELPYTNSWIRPCLNLIAPLSRFKMCDVLRCRNTPVRTYTFYSALLV